MDGTQRGRRRDKANSPPHLLRQPPKPLIVGHLGLLLPLGRHRFRIPIPSPALPHAPAARNPDLLPAAIPFPIRRATAAEVGPAAAAQAGLLPADPAAAGAAGAQHGGDEGAAAGVEAVDLVARVVLGQPLAVGVRLVRGEPQAVPQQRRLDPRARVTAPRRLEGHADEGDVEVAAEAREAVRVPAREQRGAGWGSPVGKGDRGGAEDAFGCRGCCRR